MLHSPEFNDKIGKVYGLDIYSGDRLSDYFGNIGYVLDHKDDVVTPENKNELSLMECHYKKLVEKLLVLSIPEIVTKLVEHKPSDMGTNTNIESIHKAFGIM